MVKVKVGCRRLAAGEPDAVAGVVSAISATRWAAETTGGELRTNRSSWRSPLGSGWPESTPATTLAAIEVRSEVNLVLEGSVRLVEWLARCCGTR